MSYQPTSSLKKILKLRKRLRICQGGARAGKTVAITMCLIHIAQSKPDLVISVVSESFPHLRKGALRDFMGIMKAQGYWDAACWNSTMSTYTFPNGSIIEFFAVTEESAHGPGRHILFINECNHVRYETYRQLAMRTTGPIYLDYNPVSEFYVHEKLLKRVDADFVKLTYKDNEGLPQVLVREIEMLKGESENLWRIYGEGEVGVNEGQILTNWETVERVPKKARKVRYLLDFGFSNDPAALGAIYEWNKGYVIQQMAHGTGLDNFDLANIIRKYEGLMPAEAKNKYEGQTTILCVADSAEPKSIAEMKSYGINIIGAEKGPDSVEHGIQLMQRQHFYITEYSTEFIKDARNYLWKVDKKTGKPLNVPEHEYSHFPDGLRYAITDLINPNKREMRVWRS